MTATPSEHPIGDLAIVEVGPDCWQLRTKVDVVLATVPLREVAEHLADHLADNHEWSAVPELMPALSKTIQAASLDAFQSVSAELLEQGKAIRSADYAEELERKVRLLDAWNDGQGNRAARRRFTKGKKKAIRRKR